MSLVALVHWINETAFSQYLRESELAFPLTEAIHLIGLGISVGTIVWVDLRLMGKVMRDVRISEVVSRLQPWAIGGFTVMMLSGLLLFLGKPDNYYSTAAFKLKMLLLPLAGLNVLVFHRRVFPNVARWDEGVAAPWQGRMVGAVSMSLWIVIIVLGRWTAYFADPLYRSMRLF
ncbi:MAG: hypothetical protein DMF87_14990 [Acidobacteria bacterium]|nr:MAG: hypothetical protein DMF87_14990 [Acidobacteriota bacterium]